MVLVALLMPVADGLDRMEASFDPQETARRAVAQAVVPLIRVSTIRVFTG